MARVKKVRKERKNQRVSDMFDRIRGAARGNDPIIPLVLEAVKVDATFGEIMGALKGVWGEYRLPTVF
nr:hypothetical protein [Desulfobacterales bacterium]